MQNDVFYLIIKMISRTRSSQYAIERIRCMIKSQLDRVSTLRISFSPQFCLKQRMQKEKKYDYKDLFI